MQWIGGMYEYVLTQKQINDSIYTSLVVASTINVETMSKMRAQQNETFRERYETQKLDTTLLKIIGSKAIR